MPELPEVEVLVRHLAPLISGRKVKRVQVLRPRVVRPTSSSELIRTLAGATISNLSRRGKYLLFSLTRRRSSKTIALIGHLGMTGRMYLQPAKSPLPKHAAVVLELGRDSFVFEDTRYFGRLTLDASAVSELGPEPLSDQFRVEDFGAALKRSAQPIKVRLLDQQLVAGIGNIYASEALFRAGISPRQPGRRLTPAQVTRLWKSIRETLAEAITFGSTIPLDHSGGAKRDGLFYFGARAGAQNYEERLRVYDRAGEPCLTCGRRIQRLVQASRSTFFCPQCQSPKRSH